MKANKKTRQFHRGIRSEYLLIFPGLVIVTLFLVIPTVLVVIMSFNTFTGLYMLPTFTFENYMKIFTEPIFLDRIIFTIRMALIVTVACLVLSYPISYLMAMYIKNDAYKLLIILLFLMTWWIDFTVRSLSWIPVLGVAGFLNIILTGTGILSMASDAFIFNEFSAIVVLIQGNLLFMIGSIFFSLAKINKEYLDAAITLGASRWQAFWHITFAMSKPGIVIGSVFVFVVSMSDFATPRLIGGTIVTIGLSIVNQIGILNWPLASALSTFLVAVTLALVYCMLKFADVKRILF